jgi:hypothetical protein
MHSFNNCHIFHTFIGHTNSEQNKFERVFSYKCLKFYYGSTFYFVPTNLSLRPFEFSGLIHISFVAVYNKNDLLNQVISYTISYHHHFVTFHNLQTSKCLSHLLVPHIVLEAET